MLLSLHGGAASAETSVDDLLSQGNAAFQQCQYLKSEDIYNQALIKLEKSKPAPGQLGKALDGLAATLLKLGQYPKAQQVARRAFDTWELELGNGKPELAPK